jgi:hypothetical protein
MDALYLVDVQTFKSDGHLRPLLRACMASLIMYHFDVLKDLKMTNLIPKKVLCTAEQAKICDGEHSDPTKVLRHWSRKIRKIFLLGLQEAILFWAQFASFLEPKCSHAQCCTTNNKVMSIGLFKAPPSTIIHW